MNFINPYASGGLFGHYEMIQKTWKMIETEAQLGTHLIILSENYPTSTYMTGF